MEPQYQWEFKEFCTSDVDFEEKLEHMKVQIESVQKRFNESLFEMLERYYDLSLLCEQLRSYAELHVDLDMSNSKYLQYKNSVINEKLKIDELRDILNQKIVNMHCPLEKILDQDSRLIKYRMHIYEALRIKSDESCENEIRYLTSFISKLNDLYQTILNVELKYDPIIIDGEEVIMNKNKFNNYLLDSNLEHRALAFHSFTEGLCKVNKSISQLLSMRMDICYQIAYQKGFCSVLKQLMHEDDLDMQIIESLIKVVHANLPLFHQYLELKKQSLGLLQLHFYDLKVKSSFDKKITFDESVSLVRKSLSVMGKDYLEYFNRLFLQGSIDVYPDTHKFSGSYHWRNYTKPMVLLNFAGSFPDSFVLAHECGHAINGQMIKENQTFQDFHFSVFLSEIASKVNENFVSSYLLSKSDSTEEKKYLLEQQLTNFVDSVFFQVMYLEFEMELYKKVESGEVLSDVVINNTFANIFKTYYVGVEWEEGISYLWQTRLHFFYGQYRYYNFQYATGYFSAFKISNDILKNKESMLENYLSFLKTGGSKPTLEALKVMNIDLADESIYQEGMDFFKHLLLEYEDMIKK